MKAEETALYEGQQHFTTGLFSWWVHWQNHSNMVQGIVKETSCMDIRTINYHQLSCMGIGTSEQHHAWASSEQH